jgi:hypothetical protein
VALSSVPGQAASSGSCGRERWSVKTGTDSDAGRVNLTAAYQTTISYLVSLPYPRDIPNDGRVVPVETTKWQVDATLVAYKLEHDSDYHLILNDGSRSMIAEIPEPVCVGGSSPFSAAIAHARSQFDARFNPTDVFQRASLPVRVTGIGFFDFYHGQTGAAPNQVELHPVLDVEFNPPVAATAASPANSGSAQPNATTPSYSPGPTRPASPPSSSTSSFTIRAILVVLLLGAVAWFFLRRR